MSLPALTGLRLSRLVSLVVIACLLLGSSPMPAAAVQATPDHTRQQEGDTGTAPLDPSPIQPVEGDLPATQTETLPAEPAANDQPPAGEIRETAQAVLNLPERGSSLEDDPIGPMAAWGIITTEGFETTFPRGAWTVYDADGAANGDYTWGVDSEQPQNGIYSAWPAKGGSSGVDPSSHTYPPGLNSWMVYGPFDLSVATDAELLFSYWNQSQENADYFGWYASVDGTNFFGQRVSGDGQEWVSVNFDLTTVPTLGNITGDSSVWIGFNFTSDQNEPAAYDGTFLDDITLRAYFTAGSNLKPTQPSGWDYPVVPSMQTGGSTVGTLYAYQNTYIDWAALNEGDAISASFRSCLYMDNTQASCWTTNGVGANGVVTVQDWLLNREADSGTMKDGVHSLRFVVDVDNSIPELDETDNTWTREFTWDTPTLPNLVPYKPNGYDYPIVPSSVSGTTRVNTLDIEKRTYIDWQVANKGADISETSFTICLYLDNNPLNCWTNSGLLFETYLYARDWVLNLKPTPGQHTLRIVADTTNAVQEWNENDNSWERAFTWEGNICAGVSSALDARSLTPTYQSATGPVQGDPYEILLKSRSFTPEPQAPESLARFAGIQANGKSHMLLQLTIMPNERQVAMLAQMGIHLLEYVPDKAWLVSVDANLAEILKQVEDLRWVDFLQPADKIAPQLAAALPQAGESSILVSAYTFADVPQEESEMLLTGSGAAITQALPWAHRYDLLVTAPAVNDLLLLDGVQWIDFGPTPKQAFNDCIRWRVKVDDVQAAPYNLNGAGVNLGLWDEGVSDNHTDFGTRLTIMDAGSGSSHATLVAGILAGDGTGSSAAGGLPNQWRGMAPAANLFSWNWDQSLIELQAAVTAQDLQIANLSWGITIDQAVHNNCSQYGDYSADAREYDALVRGDASQDQPPVTVVFAAGDERDDGDCGMNAEPPYLNYGNIPPPGTAKNVITVGATNSNNDTMTAYSSWGPVDDGRLKPEIVAPGDEAVNEGYIKSTAPGNTYGGAEGTSMSAPAVAGTAALLIQQYRQLHDNQDPPPALIKAVLVQTADDLTGTPPYYLPGPDYSSGYGRINAKAAIDLLKAGKQAVGMVTNGESKGYVFQVPTNTSTLKVTLAWDDAPGTPNAGPALVNNLDLVLVAPDGTEVQPWVILQPGETAGRGVDSVNNLEQVQVNLPDAGVWRAQVTGTSVLPAGQSFSLAGVSLVDEESCFTLTTSAVPASGGTISINPAPNCNSQYYRAGTTVTLTASPKSGYAFTSWAEDASGSSSSVDVVMTSNRSVKAHFTQCFKLTTAVSPSGTGTVTANISPNCSGGLYTSGTVVRISAAPNTGYGFVKWTGDVTGSVNPVNVTVNQNKSATANFSPPPGKPSLLSPANGLLLDTFSPYLSWSSPNPPAVEYEVEIALDQEFDAVLQVYRQVTETSLVTDPLDPELTYYWHVRAINQNGATGDWSNFRTFRTPLPYPELYTPEDMAEPDTLRPEFTWEEIAGATEYTFQVSTSPGFSTSVINKKVSTPAYTPTADLPYRGITLYWRVRSHGPAGTSPWGIPFEFNIPNPPSGVSLLKPANNKLLYTLTPWLDWTDAKIPSDTELKEYRLQISQDPGFETTEVDTPTGLASEYTLGTALPANTRFYWRVKACNTLDHCSNWSKVLSFRTALQPPQLIGPENEADLLTNRPEFSWQADPGAVSYTLQISASIQFRSLAASKTVRTASFPPTSDLPAGKTLYWRVRANGSNGPSDWSAVRSLTTATPPSIPALLLPANNALSRQLHPVLDWKDSLLPAGTSLDHYAVQVATDSAFTLLVVDTTSAASSFTPAEGDLLANTRYYWRICAYNNFGQFSSWSSVRSFRTVISPPELVSPENTAELAVARPKFEWQAVDGATTYTIQLSVVETFKTVAASATIKVLRWTSTKTLTAGKTYYWRVKANGPNGPSDWSLVRSFTLIE